VNIFCKVINNEAAPAEKAEVAIDKVKNSISDQDLQRLYAVEFKSQSYSSFYTTTMEKDKSILALSVAGTGFLVTLLKLTDKLAIYDMAFFTLAALGFLLAIYFIVSLFGKNADFIVDLVQEKDVTLKQHQLKQLDSWAIRAFYLGIVMSLLLGISTSSTLFIKEESNMSKEPTIEELINSGAKPANESYQQATDLTKSFQGAAGMQPQANSTQQVTPASSGSSGASAMMPKTSSDEK
jgi:hypothetical protein